MPNWRPYVRFLVYPIQFDTDPKDGIERVLGFVPEDRSADYVRALDAALASEDELAEVIPQPHSEDTIRDYLSVMRWRLEERSGATKGSTG